MKNESEQVPRWDDIIFEKRNKDYGAYAIRKGYDDNVLTGWVISLGVVAVIFLSSFLSIKDKSPIAEKTDRIICTMPPPDLKPIITPKTQPPPVPNHPVANVPPVIVDHDVVDEPQPPSEPTTTGTENGTGEPQVGAPTGVDLGTVAPPAPPQPEWILAPEVMPEFEGGYEGMMKFLQKKLRYPSGPRRRHEEGTVFVSFVVSATGAVTHVELVRGISRDLDQEAMRVISIMDKWKPGLQNKMPVGVKMVLPIKFKLNE